MCDLLMTFGWCWYDFGLFWIVSTKHIVANLTYLLQALAIVCVVKRYCRMSDWSCSYNTWIAAKRKVDVLLIMCYRAQISSLRASKSGHQILSAQISSLRASKSGHQTPRASINWSWYILTTLFISWLIFGRNQYEYKHLFPIRWLLANVHCDSRQRNAHWLAGH